MGAKRLAQMSFDRWNDVLNHIPHQNDESSCGVFVLHITDYLSCGRIPAFSQENIEILRKRTALFLDRNQVAEHVSNKTRTDDEYVVLSSRKDNIEQQQGHRKICLSGP